VEALLAAERAERDAAQAAVDAAKTKAKAAAEAAKKAAASQTAAEKKGDSLSKKQSKEVSLYSARLASAKDDASKRAIQGNHAAFLAKSEGQMTSNSAAAKSSTANAAYTKGAASQASKVLDAKEQGLALAQNKYRVVEAKHAAAVTAAISGDKLLRTVITHRN